MKRVSVLLIIVAFISVMVGCEQSTPPSHTLIIASAPGGMVTTPGHGNFTYPVGAVVDLVAIPNPSYQFNNWTGDIGAIDNVGAATTKITMYNDYSIIANFEAQYEIAAGDRHTVGLMTDGTAVAMGWNGFGQCNVGGWTDILQIAAGAWHTVGRLNLHGGKDLERSAAASVPRRRPIAQPAATAAIPTAATPPSSRGASTSRVRRRAPAPA